MVLHPTQEVLYWSSNPPAYATCSIVDWRHCQVDCSHLQQAGALRPTQSSTDTQRDNFLEWATSLSWSGRHPCAGAAPCIRRAGHPWLDNKPGQRAPATRHYLHREAGCEHWHKATIDTSYFKFPSIHGIPAAANGKTVGLQARCNLPPSPSTPAPASSYQRLTVITPARAHGLRDTLAARDPETPLPPGIHQQSCAQRPSKLNGHLATGKRGPIKNP